jgi:tetratricopeptide (TPR) repeat protein
LVATIQHYNKALALLNETVAKSPDDFEAVGQRAMLYSRTGQYEKAELDLATIGRVAPRNLNQMYHLFWKGDQEESRAEFTWLESRRNFPPKARSLGSFLLGELDNGFNYMEEMFSQGALITWWRQDLCQFLPQSDYQIVVQHPRFQSITGKYGIGDDKRDELIQMVNELTDITGIHVSLDEDY